MARLSLVEEKQFSPEYAQLVERVRDADGYVSFLSILGHRQEVVEPMWKAYADMFEGGIVIGFDIAFGRLLRVFDADPKTCELPGTQRVNIPAPAPTAVRA